MAFMRIVAKSKFPTTGRWASVSKSAVSLNAVFSAEVKQFKKVDLLYDQETRRLGFCFLNGQLRGSYNLIKARGGNVLHISSRKVLQEINAEGIFPVTILPAKEVPPDYAGQKIFVVCFKEV